VAEGEAGGACGASVGGGGRAIVTVRLRGLDGGGVPDPEIPRW
jgi:hypothetical protein